MSNQIKQPKAYKEKLQVKRLNVVLDEELHTKLKVTAFEQGVTMSQYVTELLKKELEQPDQIKETAKER